MKLLVELNQKRGITIAMVTHESDMAQFVSRTVTFRDGVVEWDSASGDPPPPRSGRL
jgi:putative ABC transport system ATP-binding protein